MRTTVDIHDSLLERAKALASERGQRLADVVNDALLEMFDRRAREKGDQVAEEAPMPVSSVAGKGLQPGVDLSDSSSLNDVLDGLEVAGLPGCRRSSTSCADAAVRRQYPDLRLPLRAPLMRG